VGGVRKEMSELMWRPDMWDPTPHQRKQSKIAHESAERGLNVWFEKFVGVQYLVCGSGLKPRLRL
jgi:hypothetical protein